MTHDLLSDLLMWSSGLVSAIDQTISIGLHIIFAGITALILVVVIPEEFHNKFDLKN